VGDQGVVLSAGGTPQRLGYVRLRPADRLPYLAAGEIEDISFNGRSTLPPLPVRWRVDETPPNHRTPALYSGSGPNFDRAIVQQVRVPAADPTLRFDTKWRTENHWDFGFVQVSTDGGETYQSLGNKDTTRQTNAGTVETVKENVPGFTGNSNGWRSERFDLSAYAGERILLSFRYVTDGGVDLPGWWVDEVAVGGKTISVGSAIGEWSSPTEIVSTPVAGFTVQLVAYDDAGTEAWVGDIELDGSFDGSLSGAEVAAEVGTTAETVGAIVTYDEPTEDVLQYAPYRLTVNGVLQPGG